ncbi:MAG: lysylphosphatidylglycerol synthase transmembrane domain-containing protein [Sedimentisphaerales bacterium]
MTQNSKKSKHISHLIRIAIAAAALYFAFKGESVHNIVKVFGNLNIFIFLAAVALYAAGNLVFVLRWLMLLRTQGIHVDYWPALKLHLLGLFYNNCLPGSVGGDLLRAWYVTMHTEKKIEAAMSVFVDRTVGMVCTIAMVFLTYWLVPKGGIETQFSLGADFSPASLAIKFLIVILALVILAAIVLAVCYSSRKLRPTLLKYVFIFGLKWKLWFDRVINAVKLYCCRPFILLLAVLLTFFCQSMPIYGLYLVGKNLGIEANLRYYFMFFPLSWIIGIIPISVGGAGVMELGLKGLFGKVAQVTETQGLILALTQRLTWLIISIPGVVIHLTGKHLPNKEEIEKEIIS